MLLPPRFCWIALTALELMPGAGMWAPEAVEREDRRREQDLLADLRDPETSEDRGDHPTAPQLSTTWQVPPAASMRSRAVLEKPWAWTVSAIGDLALGEDLDRNALARGQALALQRLERDRVAGGEARLEVEQVDRLGVGPERLERHRLLHVRAAQLAHPHVDRHLAALEAGALLGARARAVALLAAAGGLAGARALAAADPLARPARARGGLEVVQADALLGLLLARARSSTPRTSTRWRDLGDHAADLRACR